MRQMILILMMLIFGNILCGKEVIILPDLSNPHSLAVDMKQIYITERSNVFIYSYKDFKLKKKIGKRGEGPGEFKGLIRFVYAWSDELYFNSSGKVSYFTKDGIFKEEFKLPNPDMKVKPIGMNFIGAKVIIENSILYLTINLYDRKLKKIKELHRQKKEVQPAGKGTRIFAHALPFHTRGNQAFIVKGNELCIDVLDKSGNKLHEISYDYKKVRVQSSIEKQVINYLKTSPNNAPYFKSMQPILFPTYFPAIQKYYIADGKVYVFIYSRHENKNEVLVFHTNGKFIKSSFVSYAFIDPIQEYPATIKNGQLFQLVENEKSELWELHISQIN